ncbi:sugar porter family MFS transporter [Corynebacterium striatum]|uniref:sugar porter family MFS transporter n=1 Tax=Corynebacterium striatum TaxID=43770 RepID=UPI0019200722|nr:sugar porter family MFS transporter [Corynebacterium striatum]MCG7250463.1 sugar porter family MFS transporter [Corynebacterium striatum]QQU80731.1 sugar porter family MFS transporter [Corynebacterium striatum]HAT1181874.1 sugar porter family MFS transporter [Corynebacterium striatum]HAT1243552.1 sugar porter family MFS transporter [Corynebacterium striatum]HAT6541029.1 sugar porter family MFS transporter [Corynebacterium striatum]
MVAACKDKRVKNHSFVKAVAIVAALGGLLFGYDTGVMSGALLFIGPEFDMNSHEEGWVTSMLLVGAAFGALVAGRVADALGRRKTLILGGCVFVLGSIWCAVADSVFMLALARAFLGVAVGAVSIVSPMYISEISPARVRGRLVSLNTLMIVVGQLLAYLVNSALAGTGSWRWMLGLAAVPGLLLVVGMFFLPDTPVWLLKKRRVDEAWKLAARVGIRGTELGTGGSADSGAAGGAVKRSEWQRLKGERWLQVTVLLAMLMGLTQQITGVNAIVYFAPTMMNQVGISTSNAVYTSILIGTVSVIACWFGLKAVDRIGRKRLLMIGLIGNVVSLLVLSIAYRFAEGSTTMALVSLAFMALFIAFQQAAVSPTTWLLISELVPVEVRGIGMGIAGLSLWVTNWAVAQFFLPMVDWLTGPVAFMVFGFLGILAIAYTKLLIPETMGRSLEDVGDEMQARYAN